MQTSTWKTSESTTAWVLGLGTHEEMRHNFFEPGCTWCRSWIITYLVLTLPRHIVQPLQKTKLSAALYWHCQGRQGMSSCGGLTGFIYVKALRHFCGVKFRKLQGMHHPGHLTKIFPSRTPGYVNKKCLLLLSFIAATPSSKTSKQNLNYWVGVTCATRSCCAVLWRVA